RRAHARGFAGRGEDVHGQGDAVAAGAGLDVPGPHGAHGHADTAFVHVGLAAPEIAVVGAAVGLAAVVRGEDDEGVVGLTTRLQTGHDAADAVVHVFDEGDQRGAVRVDAGF